MRLIDADALIGKLHEVYFFDSDDRETVYKVIQEQPTILPLADAMPVVHCKDCAKREYCRTSTVWAMPPKDDWFCADGERRQEDV